jgi:epoxyqueuosine reductase
MDWMEKRADWRADPQAMWPQARSVIVLALNYWARPRSAGHPGAQGARRDLGLCVGDDYHDIVKKKLKVLAGHIFQAFGAEVKVFVDTAPVMEKPLAQKAGLGWQGKHTNLGSREFGSWLFPGQHLHDLGPATG